MTEIAKAYVQIVPTTKDIKSNLTGAMDGEAESAGKSAGSKWASGLGAAAKGAVTAVAAGITAATGAAAAMTKSAVDSYADYEQFVGGIETLFGDSAGKVIKDASEAFKTAGMSANDYMDTAITSAAAMINSLGGDTEKAASMMNMSITDMSDNVNKMGTSMQGVQDAYRGFSRGNFTMLDNLALGFAGTKEGMQELLDKAQELSGVEYDIDSYADIVQAIHVVQSEMGITGTTAKEAGETIAGSIGAMKSAWQNLVTGLADGNADIEGLVRNLVGTIVGENGEGGVLGNIIPAVQQTLNGITQMISTAAPQIVPIIVQLIAENLPQLIEAGVEILKALVKGIIDALPKLMDAAVDIIFTIADGIIESLPELIPAVVEVVLTIVEKLTEPDTLMKLIEAAFKIIGAIAEGLLKAVPKLIEKVPQIIGNLIQAILEFLPQMLESGAQLIVEMAKGIVGAVPEIIKAVIELLANLKEAFFEKIEEAKEWGRDLIGNFASGIKNAAGGLWNTVKSIAGGIKSFLGFSEPEDGPLSNFHTYAPDMMRLFAQGIRENEYLVTDQIEKSFDFGRRLAPAAASGSGAAATGGDTYYFNINVDDLQDLQGLIAWAKNARTTARTR